MYVCFFGGSQKGGFQKGGFGGCSPGTKTGTRVRSPKPPFWKPPFYLPVSLFGVDKGVVSKRVVSADVPPERRPERGYVRQNHPFTKPPFYLPVTFEGRGTLTRDQDISAKPKQARAAAFARSASREGRHRALMLLHQGRLFSGHDVQRLQDILSIPPK